LFLVIIKNNIRLTNIFEPDFQSEDLASKRNLISQRSTFIAHQMVKPISGWDRT